MAGEFDAWLGRTEEVEDCVTIGQARRMAATLDIDNFPFSDGAPLPPLWHWMAWTPDAPMSRIGPDGHTRRGDFWPPVPLERRMWAGGRLTFHSSPKIGEKLVRRSEITKIASKTGGAGEMVFVTVLHEIRAKGEIAITEEQDIVYIAMPERFAPPPPTPVPEAIWEEPVAIDPVRLFRFSAVTFNGHRIHYDLPYAQEVEKYPGLVVHGPFQAVLLMEAARRHRGDAVPRRFKFRGVRPLFHFDPARIVAAAEADGSQVLCTATSDYQCMQGEVTW
ncbi:MAG: acyl dehydratase [Cereibacter sphaeroides]|uniref:Acyl dehydratase n=1 Tax=Cereibacter sphaeroides TaxID=1063 RepID=A0A2W5UP58_CERSP|nr:MAG: acyl dehydratase [Cereibacter sphaeroides]